MEIEIGVAWAIVGLIVVKVILGRMHPEAEETSRISFILWGGAAILLWPLILILDLWYRWLKTPLNKRKHS